MSDNISPPEYGAAVVPNDGADLDEMTRAINVSGGGDVALVTEGGSSIIINVVAGIAFPITARRILATGTTATGIVALW